MKSNEAKDNKAKAKENEDKDNEANDYFGNRDLIHNINKLKANIGEAARQANRDPGSIRVVAVTKTLPPARVQEAVEAGLTDLGENRLQEALEKIKVLPSRVRWHFIGHLQTNKVRDVLGKFSLIHSLDSIKLAREINQRAGSMGLTADTLIQVNISGEKSKYGLEPREIEDFLAETCKMQGLRIKGLMTMAPYAEHQEESRPVFRELRLIQNRLQGRVPEVELDILSMGMSTDYQVAIEEGANIIRVGTILFGPRN